MAIVILNPQLHIAKTLFDLGYLIGSLVREPSSTPHGLSHSQPDSYSPTKELCLGARIMLSMLVDSSSSDR